MNKRAILGLLLTVLLLGSSQPAFGCARWLKAIARAVNPVNAVTYFMPWRRKSDFQLVDRTVVRSRNGDVNRSETQVNQRALLRQFESETPETAEAQAERAAALAYLVRQALYADEVMDTVPLIAFRQLMALQPKKLSAESLEHLLQFVKKDRHQFFERNVELTEWRKIWEFFEQLEGIPAAKQAEIRAWLISSILVDTTLTPALNAGDSARSSGNEKSEVPLLVSTYLDASSENPHIGWRDVSPGPGGASYPPSGVVHIVKELGDKITPEEFRNLIMKVSTFDQHNRLWKSSDDKNAKQAIKNAIAEAPEGTAKDEFNKILQERESWGLPK